MMYDTDHLENDKHYKGKSWGWIPPSQEVYDAFHYVKNNVNPRKMLEIGFYKGHSTSYWAQTLPDCEIYSCGPPHRKFLQFAPIVKSKYPNVKDMFPYESPEVWKELFILNGSDAKRRGHTKTHKYFPFVFIDGQHLYGNVILDITLAVDILRAEWVMFDNHEKEDVQDAIKCHGKLKLEQVFPYQCDMYVEEEDGSETLVKINLELALYCKI